MSTTFMEGVGTMDMDKIIARINELARKNKSVGLTAEEEVERTELRAQYMKIFKANFKQKLDNIKFVDEDQADDIVH